MGIGRDDRFVTDAQGRALAGVVVYYCTQPATTSVIPPSPLATLYSDLGGDPLTNPVITDGFGHSVAYMDDTVLYTIVFVHPLFGPNPVILIDQAIAGSGGGGGTTVTPFQGQPIGTIDGANRVFLLAKDSVPLNAIPAQATVWLNFPLIPGAGYSLSLVSGQVQITYAVAPQPASGSVPADALWAEGIITS